MSVPNRAEHPGRKMGDYTTPHFGTFTAADMVKKDYYADPTGSHMRRHVNAQLNLTNVRTGVKQPFVDLP